MTRLQLRSLFHLQYRGPGILMSAIYHETNAEYDQDHYLILVRRDSDWIVAMYADGDWEWSTEHCFTDRYAAMSCLLKMAAERWDIDWSADWGLAK